VSTFRPVLVPEANRGAVALVTGGGTGVGRATALELGRTGAKVAICGRRTEPLERTCQELAAAGVDCLSIPTDIRDEEQAASLVTQVIDRFGKIDILINNAGGQFQAPLEAISPKGWRAVHSLAVDAAWRMTWLVATHSMIPNRQGVVVFVGLSPRRGMPGFAHAAAARAAVENLAGSLALEWSKYNIRSVCVALGAVDTAAGENYPEDQRLKFLDSIPVRRRASPEEIASVLAFLTSPGASFITGTTVVVDGGMDAWGFGWPTPPMSP